MEEAGIRSPLTQTIAAAPPRSIQESCKAPLKPAAVACWNAVSVILLRYKQCMSVLQLPMCYHTFGAQARIHGTSQNLNIHGNAVMFMVNIGIG